MTLSRATSLGIGSMVGAGIFALLGEVGTAAGSAVWMAFLAGGIIALLNGYSYGRLGARYPSAGGPVDYLARGYGTGVFSGGLSLFYYAAAIIGMAMVARAFGSYGAALLGADRSSPLIVGGLAALIVVLLAVVNAAGSASVGRLEVVVVAIKLTVLALFVVGGAFGVSSHLFRAQFDAPAPGALVVAVGFAFFAYTGFGVVTNAAAEMRDPQRELPRALMTSILIVMALYIAIAFVAFGSLPVKEILADKDTALAVAARPVFGSAGFTVMAIAAMLATASAINATLYGSTNVSYVLAKRGQLPEGFDRRVWREAPEGLFITVALVLVFATVLNLSQVAALGSLAALLVYIAVGVAHVRLRSATRANLWLLLLAILTTTGTTVVFIVHMASTQPAVLALGVGVLAAAFAAEVVLRRLTSRRIVPDPSVAA